jgi:hypothetical protein
MEFCMEVDLNMWHNFCIRHFDQRSTIFTGKLEFRERLELDRSLDEIHLNLLQTHDYNMINMNLTVGCYSPLPYCQFLSQIE